MVEINRIYNENCLDTMEKIDTGSVDLIVTSPPYYLNKEYEKSITYPDYCKMMESVFRACSRILKGGGYAVFNFGDYFNSGNRFYDADVPACYPASINYFNWGVNIAQMDLQATRIWRKQFSKMGIPFVCNKHPRPVFDYEHVWTFRKRNGIKTEFVTDRKLTQKGVLGEDWISSAGLKTHCASFPVELPTWAISVYSQREKELVYDPFMGSGTTAIAARNLNRNYIGSEISKTYLKIAENRLIKNKTMFE